MKKEMPTRSITFPTRCVVCSGAPETWRTVSARKAMDLIVFRYESETQIRIPICHRCNRRRAWAPWLIWPLLLAAAIALFILGISQAIDGSAVLGGGAMIAAFALFLFLRGEWLSGILDYLLLGVGGVTHNQKGELTTLAIRDPSLSAEVEKLTREAESSEILLRAAASGPPTPPQELLRSSEDETKAAP